MKKNTQVLVTAIITGLMGAGVQMASKSARADETNTDKTTTTTTTDEHHDDADKASCKGKEGCKGEKKAKDSCKGEKHSCKGKEGCKGKGKHKSKHKEVKKEEVKKTDAPTE